MAEAQKDMLEDVKRTSAYYNAVMNNRAQFAGKVRRPARRPQPLSDCLFHVVKYQNFIACEACAWDSGVSAAAF